MCYNLLNTSYLATYLFTYLLTYFANHSDAKMFIWGGGFIGQVTDYRVPRKPGPLYTVSENLPLDSCH